MHIRLHRTFAALLILAACSSTGDGDAADADASAEYFDAGKADGQSQPKVQASGITLWVDRNAIVEERDGEQVLVIRGRTSKNLESVFSWVPDDAFGVATVTSARKFEVVLELGHEANTILSGLPINVEIEAATGSVRHYQAQIALEGRFARFSTSASGLWLEQEIHPIYVKDAADSLRYRGSARTDESADSLTISTADGTDPVVRRDDEETWSFDWAYGGFEAVFDDALAPVHFAASVGGDSIEKDAGVDLRVVSLRITTEDPETAWPDEGCDLDVFDCIAATPPDALDYAACGDYRPVQRCVFADACEVHEPEPLALVNLDSTALESARATYEAGCGSGGDWCSMGTISAYSIPACPADQVTMPRLAELVAEQHQGFATEGGAHLIGDQLASTPAFGVTYSDGGPALRDALASFAGSTHVEAYVVTTEVPCQNCTDFVDSYVLFYSLVGRVVSFEAGHGFDS